MDEEDGEGDFVEGDEIDDEEDEEEDEFVKIERMLERSQRKQ